MTNLLLVGLGGALGSMSRYLMTAWVTTWWAKGFPLATLLINLAGSFLMGIAFVVIVDRLDMLPQARALVMVGFLGGFTTFSSFSLETYQLLLRGEWSSAVLYALASVILCVFAVVLGIWLARMA